MRYSGYSKGKGKGKFSDWEQPYGYRRGDDYHYDCDRPGPWGKAWRDKTRGEDWKNEWKGWHGKKKKGWCPDDNTPPDAADDALTVLDPDSAITGNLLDNDTDDDGDDLAVTQINGIETQVGVTVVLPEGQITVEADGSYTIQATEDFSFTYTVSDGDDTDTATVDVNVIDPVLFLAPRNEMAAIWKTNGTPDGTVEILNFNDAGVQFVRHMTPFKDGFLFQGFDDATRSEPWFTDGTVAGTFRLADLNDTGSSGPFGFTVLGDTAFFNAGVPGIGTELYITDGTPAGTKLLADIRLGPDTSNPSAFLATDEFVFFNAGTDDEGIELYRTDGTTDGTFLLQDIRPGPGSSAAQPLFVLDGKAVFRANQDNNGRELWISDGTVDGTILLSDNTFGAGLGPAGEAYFFRRDDGGTYDLWRTDGTVDGTEFVADTNTNKTGTGFTELGDVFMFVANYRRSDGFELWRTDGTDSGTFLVRNINSTGDDVVPFEPAFYNAALSPVGDGLIFVVDDGVNGKEPWFTDGTFEGTYLIEDINPSGNSLGSNQRFAPLQDGRTLFQAGTPDEGRELWVSDGTPEGTFLLADIENGPGSSFPDNFIF